jgi:hypothetical protein
MTSERSGSADTETASGLSTRSLATWSRARSWRPRCASPGAVPWWWSPITRRIRAVPSLGIGASGSDEEILTAAYRSDLTSLMLPAPIEGGRNSLRPADLWIFGHTHESEDVTIGCTRVVSNAKGYGPWLPQHRAWDNRRFDPNFVIEI